MKGRKIPKKKREYKLTFQIVINEDVYVEKRIIFSVVYFVWHDIVYTLRQKSEV